MDELLGAILGAIAEFLLEAFLELIAAAILDLASRVLLGLFRSLAEAVKDNRALTDFMYALLGVLSGAFSLLASCHILSSTANIPSGFTVSAC